MGYSNISTKKTTGCTGEARTSVTLNFPSFVKILPGEKILSVRHPFLLNYFWCYVFAALLFVLTFLGFLIPEDGIVVGVFATTLFLCGIIVVLFAWITVAKTCYVITDKRVISKQGLVSVNVSEVRINDIRGVNFSRGIWQAIIGTGNVSIGTAATCGVEIRINGVKNASALVDLINTLRKS